MRDTLARAGPVVEELAGLFAKSFAMYTVEVLTMLEARERRPSIVGNTEPNDDSPLESAPEWVQGACRRASKAKRVVGVDQDALRARLLRNRLGVALKKQGMTQAALAKKLRKSQSQVSRIIRHPERTKLETLNRIANALKVDLSDILRNLGRSTTKT